MLIDWFTVGAQTLNFLVLVWLLKRFLYQPILHAIDAREQRIAAELAEAATKKAEAGQERAELDHKREEFDGQRAALLSKAIEEAKAERQRLLDEAREESESARTRREEALRQEQQSLGEEISRRTRDEVFAIARKAFGDLASASLEERMVEVLLQRLRALSDEEKAALRSAFQEASDPVTVRSVFELPPAQRSNLESAVSELLTVRTPLQFASAPGLISGIELTANGRKISWSIADYLSTLEKSVAGLLPAKS